MNWRLIHIGIVVLACVSLLQYSGTIRNPLIWDSERMVMDDPSIRSLVNIPGFFTSASVAAEQAKQGEVTQLPYYRPVLKSFLALEYALFGADPLGYHVVNVLLSAVVIVLFFWVLLAITESQKLAFFAALLYAVNPARGEAVYWTYGGANQLLAVAVFATLYFHHRHWLIAAGVAAICSLLIREEAVLLPLAILLYELLIRRSAVREAALRVIPYIVIVAVYLVVRTIAVGGMPAVTEGVGPVTLLNTIVVIVQRFFSLVIVPSAPVALFPKELFPSLTIEVALSYGVAFLFAGALVWSWRKRPSVAFCLAWAFLWISIWFNVGRFGDYLMTEKGMYLSAAGFCVIAAALLIRLPDRWGVALLGLIVCTHFTITFARGSYWRDPMVFFKQAIASAPEFAPPRYELGMLYAEKGEYPAGIEQFEAVVKFVPDHSLALNNLGNSYFALGDIRRAAGYWSRAVEADPGNAMAIYNMGFASERLGDFRGALGYYKRYAALVPSPPPALLQRIRQLESR